jgi:hypothetical protein
MKNKYNTRLFSIFLILLIFIGVSVYFGFSHRADVILNISKDEVLSFAPSSGPQLQIPICQIESAELLTSFKPASYEEEYQGRGYTCGICKTDTSDKYCFYFYDSCSHYIRLKTQSAGYVIFNYINNDTTDGFYSGLLKLILKE